MCIRDRSGPIALEEFKDNIFSKTDSSDTFKGQSSFLFIFFFSFIHVPDVLHLISRDDRPKTLFPRIHCSVRHISRFTTEFVLRKVVALFKSRKPAARHLDLSLIPKFLFYFHCKLLDERSWLECVVRFSSWNNPRQHHSRIVKYGYASSHWKILFRNPLLLLKMFLTCVFPQPNFSASLHTPVNPLLFSYSSRIWKHFSKGNPFLAFCFVLSFGVIECYHHQ